MVESQSLRVFTSNATRNVLDELSARYTSESGTRVSVESDSASVMLERIRAGEGADAAVLNAPDIAALVSEKRICGSRPFARSRIGVAVCAGTPHPDISSVPSFKRAHLDARTIAHTVHGASGRLVPCLLKQLGIAGEVTTVTRPGGLIARVVAAGEAAVAIQQISELLAVPGVEVVGPLPETLQAILESAAGVFAESRNADAAEAFLQFITAPAAAPVLEQKGLERAMP